MGDEYIKVLLFSTSQALGTVLRYTVQLEDLASRVR